MTDVDESVTTGTHHDEGDATWSGWAALVRLPNSFTLIADVTAGFAVAHAAIGIMDAREGLRAFRWLALIAAIAMGLLLYWAGMILNDLCDLPQDRENQRPRPLVTGQIRQEQARRLVWIFFVSAWLASLATAWLSWHQSGMPLDRACVCPVIVTSLILSIVAYDGPMKAWAIAPAIMGGCRSLSSLLGASLALAFNPGTGESWTDLGVVRHVPVVSLIVSVAMGTYITGITLFARREREVEQGWNLKLGLGLMMLGMATLAGAPSLAKQFEPGRVLPWRVDPSTVFPIAILLMVAPTLLRGMRAIRAPSPRGIGLTIKFGIQAIIPLSAALTLATLNTWAGLVVLALLIPAAWLSRRFAVT
ncbi:MAG: UbiA family prenyltransferase [Planctomycetota bacterium]